MSYNPTKEEQEASLYCIRNCIRIAPKGIFRQKRWHIDVSMDGINWHTSPESYEEKDLWKKYYEVCTYYWNKRDL